MAETKTKKRAAPKRAKTSQKRKAQKPRSTKSKSTAKSSRAKSSKSSSAKTRRKATANGNGAGQVEAVRDTIEDKAKDARKAVSGAADKAGDVASKAGSKAGDAASKAKVPLLAGGAALAGAGIALAARQGSHHRGPIAKAMRKPRIKLDSADIAKAAKQVGKVSTQVGELAGGVQRASESTSNGNGHHRSPIEVVLQGLTARR